MKYRVLCAAIHFPRTKAEYDRIKKCHKAGESPRERDETTVRQDEEVEFPPYIDPEKAFDLGVHIEPVASKRKQANEEDEE